MLKPLQAQGIIQNLHHLFRVGKIGLIHYFIGRLYRIRRHLLLQLVKIAQRLEITRQHPGKLLEPGHIGSELAQLGSGKVSLPSIPVFGYVNHPSE